MNLGWIDFSDNDRKKTMDVLRLFQEQGAVDELGIGIGANLQSSRELDTLPGRVYFVQAPVFHR